MEKLPDYLNREEVEQILEIASRHSFRDYLMIKMMSTTPSFSLGHAMDNSFPTLVNSDCEQ